VLGKVRFDTLIEDERQLRRQHLALRDKIAA